MEIDTPAWVRDAVFYQVLPDRLARSGRVPAPGVTEEWDAAPTRHGFKGGDLFGVIGHLDRLERLGVNALYLNPIFTSASNHGYHTDDYYSVDPLLGGNDALRELLDEAHERDMHVVLDGVFNHSGRGWFPFHHLLENGMESPYRDWFHLDPAVRAGDRPVVAFPSARQLEVIDELKAAGAPSGEASRRVLGFETWWDLPALPKLNLDDPQCRGYVLDVAEYWIRFGIDGWRLDVPDEVGADFWRDFRRRVRAVDPDAYLVAEIWHDRPEWLRGDMFDAFMNYPLALGILGFAGQENLTDDGDLPGEYQGEFRIFDGQALWDRITHLAETNGEAVTNAQLNLLGSHDTPRMRTLLGGDTDAVRLATLLQLTLPGAPCIYYGDEIGMEGHMDPDCRGGFPADPVKWQLEPADWITDLAGLRHRSRAFRDGELSLLGADGAMLAYLRRDTQGAYVVVANASADRLERDLELPFPAIGAEVVPLRGGRAGERSAEVRGDLLRIELGRRDGMVVRLLAS